MTTENPLHIHNTELREKEWTIADFCDFVRDILNNNWENPETLHKSVLDIKEVLEKYKTGNNK